MMKTVVRNFIFIIMLALLMIQRCEAHVGISIGVGTVFAPAPYYPVYYPVVYPEPYPELGWVPGHWECNYWVPGHYVQLWREPVPAYMFMGGCYHCHHWHHHHHCC